MPIELREANPTVVVRSGRLHELVHAVSVGRGPVSQTVKRVIKALTPRSARRDALRAVQSSVLYSANAPADEELMLELRRTYRGEVVALSEYLGRDLVKLWGYDELAEHPDGRRELRVPDFFIVGHAKSGTTALYEMLRGHPQIYMPEEKEPWYFATDMRPRFKHPMAGAAPETLEEYLALFADAGPEQIIGEASTSYLWSRTAAARDRRGRTRRPLHRGPARARELPALAAPSARSDPRRVKERPADGHRSGGRARAGPAHPAPLAPPAAAAVLRPRPLCRAAAPV